MVTGARPLRRRRPARVRRLIEGARYELVSVVVTPAAFEGLADVRARVTCPVHVVERSALASLTGFDFHRGCLALAKRPGAEPPLEAFAGARRLIALESVANPDNVGGLFRVAAAFDAGGVLLDCASGDPFYRKAIRTSAALTPIPAPLLLPASPPRSIAIGRSS